MPKPNAMWSWSVRVMSRRSGCGETLGIAVGGADRGDHQRVPGDGLSSQLYFTLRDPGGTLHRAVVAQQLLDRARQQRWIFAQSIQLIRMLEQGEEPVADQVHRGLVPGDENQHAGREQLVLAQLVALLLRGDQ